MKNIKQNRKGNYKFILGLIILFTSTLLISCDKKENAIREKYKCENFEDCLSKNEFDGAYEFYSLKKQEIEAKGGNSKLNNFMDGQGDELNKKYHQLINAQLSFWVKQKNFERAFNILQEYFIEAKYNLNTDDEDDNEPYNEEVSFYNNLLDDLINKMIVEEQPKEVLLLYCKSFKPIVKGDENNKSLFGGFKSYVLSDEPYKVALAKVNELKK